MPEAWTIGCMLERMQSYFRRRGVDNPKVSARWLISEVAGLSFAELYTNLDAPLSSAEVEALYEYSRRRADSEPLQYITGKTSFRKIDIQVSENVLIPRPETEILVGEVLKVLPNQKDFAFHGCGRGGTLRTHLLIADLCTGSGCVACSIAFENPSAKVVATDISKDCVSLASANVERLLLSDRVEVIECDLGEGIDPSLSGEFDAIVSNPPYIPTGELSLLPDEVRLYEPLLALDGGADGLACFRRIAAWSSCALKRGGVLACELHEDTLECALDIAARAGFADVRKVKDLAGRDRVLVAEKA